MNSTSLLDRRATLPPVRVPRRPGAGPPATAKRRVADAPWVRLALIALLVCTAAAYIWDLSASGYANSFYAAAVQAGTKSWKAFFFGSIDSSSFITVDKPPASLWVMALSGRIFGFSSWSMLIPQALEGVAAVALLYAAVKRWFGAGSGLVAGAVLAVTPVAALMFRYNNPDALLVLLLVASAYCLTRALERGSTRWVVATGAMIGFAFLAKMGQAFLVVPGFALVYLVAAPTGLRRRLGQMVAGAVAIVVSCGWWVAIVALWPVGSRPFIDGSPSNSIFNLILGYNGLGRIFGNTGPGGGGGGGANFSGPTGLLRLFNDAMGGQASWLLPAAIVAFLVGLWMRRRAPRTDRARAALMLWGGWLFVSAVVFSLSSGVIHTYYTVAIAPAIAALVAIGASMLWRRRETLAARGVMAAAVLVTAIWSWVLLDRTPQWESWLRAVILVSAVLAVAGLLAGPALRRIGRRVTIATAVVAAVACLAGPVAYSAQTITTGHTGSIPSAGPSAGDGVGLGGGGGRQSGGVSSALATALEANSSHFRWVAAVSGSQNAASLELATGGAPVMAIGGFNNQGGNLTLAQFKAYVASGDIHYYLASSGGPGGGASAVGGGFSGRGGPPAGARPGSGGGAPGASGAPLAGARPSGATGTGAGPGGDGPGGAGPGGAGGSQSAITAWVKAHYKSVTIGGQTVYDLTQPLA
ncbi:MAG TPA: glycosyltransferase family 39 protein [Solirubrobacteraceae bacterium]|nr:glycosyltransferase family 39 protein [Solirubrobacteraceae bacterium]